MGNFKLSDLAPEELKEIEKMNTLQIQSFYNKMLKDRNFARENEVGFTYILLYNLQKKCSNAQLNLKEIENLFETKPDFSVFWQKYKELSGCYDGYVGVPPPNESLKINCATSDGVISKAKCYYSHNKLVKLATWGAIGFGAYKLIKK